LWRVASWCRWSSERNRRQSLVPMANEENSPKRLLIVYHSVTGGTASMLDAVARGAHSAELSRVEVSTTRAFDTQPEHVLAAHAILLGTPENFGYMSGALKDFFERIYYPCLAHTQGLPFGLFIRAGNDGEGARMAIERITTGLRWRLVAPPVIARGELTAAHLAACHELGETVASGLELGIF